MGALDLSLGGNTQAWVRVARPLKARIYLHTAEVNPQAYALALAQAQQGINSPSGDLNEYHSSSAGEENIWWQFIARDRDSYTRPGKVLVDLMNSRNDPRLPEYFAENGSGGYQGASPEGLDTDKHSNLSATRLDPTFLQPVVTWAENQAIIAEASYRTGAIGPERTALDALRAHWGLAPVGASLSGAALLTKILEEKYIALFQNYEVYNDYKRTCYPNLTPSSNAYQGNIPGRFTYPVGADVEPERAIAQRTTAPQCERPGDDHGTRRLGLQGPEARCGA